MVICRNFRDGGKPAVISKLKNDYGYNPIIMIGDGATDMQAKPPADAFIGFGGVVEREKVKLNADWYIYDFKVKQLYTYIYIYIDFLKR